MKGTAGIFSLVSSTLKSWIIFLQISTGMLGVSFIYIPANLLASAKLHRVSAFTFVEGRGQAAHPIK